MSRPRTRVLPVPRNRTGIDYFAAIGPESGMCGHQHDTPGGARRCAEAHARDARTAGGVPDRVAFVVRQGATAVRSSHDLAPATWAWSDAERRLANATPTARMRESKRRMRAVRARFAPMLPE